MFAADVGVQHLSFNLDFDTTMFALATILAILISIQAVVGNGKVNPDTVDSLDISKYLGLWYQIAADQIVYSTFEQDAYCCTALYGDNGGIDYSIFLFF